MSSWFLIVIVHSWTIRSLELTSGWLATRHRSCSSFTFPPPCLFSPLGLVSSFLTTVVRELGWSSPCSLSWFPCILRLLPHHQKVRSKVLKNRPQNLTQSLRFSPACSQTLSLFPLGDACFSQKIRRLFRMFLFDRLQSAFNFVTGIVKIKLYFVSSPIHFQSCRNGELQTKVSPQTRRKVLRRVPRLDIRGRDFVVVVQQGQEPEAHRVQRWRRNGEWRRRWTPWPFTSSEGKTSWKSRPVIADSIVSDKAEIVKQPMQINPWKHI